MYARSIEFHALKALVESLQMRVEALEAGNPTAVEAEAVPHTEVDIPAQTAVTEKVALDDDLVALLAQSGYNTPLSVRKASDDDLLSIKGIGAATLKKIREEDPEGG
jgi:hypothetical protein